MFRLVKGLKIDINEVEGRRCIRGNCEKLCFNEKEGGNVWKVYMEGITNEEKNGIMMWREMQ